MPKAAVAAAVGMGASAVPIRARRSRRHGLFFAVKGDFVRTRQLHCIGLFHICFILPHHKVHTKYV